VVNKKPADASLKWLVSGFVWGGYWFLASNIASANLYAS